jgi:rubrerythrin
MKKIVTIVAIMLISLLLSGCEDLDVIVENDEVYVEDAQLDVKTEINDETLVEIDDELDEDEDPEVEHEYSEIWGSVSALDTENLTLEAMLIYAIQDEYSAYAEYDYILNNFEVTKPFSNIINAEASHIQSLLPLFETHEIEVPYNDAENHLIPVTDLADTFRTGVIAEILNIDMYNLFLEQDLPDDVRDVFVALRDASVKHLAAFEQNLAKYE